MANLAKLDFVALDITGKNRLTWVVDAKIHLEVGNLGVTIKEENGASSQDLVKVMISTKVHVSEASAENRIRLTYQSAKFEECGIRERYNSGGASMIHACCTLFP